MLFNLKLPTVLDNTLTFISNSVTAISLVMAGASFNFDIDSKKIPKIIYTLTFKMIFTPIITILLCILFKMNNFQTIVLVCMYSSPIAVSSFATAKGYDTDIDLASNCLVYSYVLAMITLPIIISVISLIGLI